MGNLIDLQKEVAELEAQAAKVQQEEAAPEQVPEAAAIPIPAASERRSQFTGDQQRLAAALSRGNKAFDIIEGSSSVTATSDKLVVLQVISLMLDEDGNDGILYAATGWSSGSKQTLADRMGDHKNRTECNPQWRLGMQSPERQQSYTKKLAADLKLPYVVPKPERGLEDATRMTSQEFAEFAVTFHRKALLWDLKQYVYDNLKIPASEFFAGFVQLQKESDAQEDAIYKGAHSAHLRAVDPELGEDEARDFLGMLSSMRWRENREKERAAKRIADRTMVAPEPQPEPAPEPTVEDPKAKVKALTTVYDRQAAEIRRQLEALKAEQLQESTQ